MLRKNNGFKVYLDMSCPSDKQDSQAKDNESLQTDFRQKISLHKDVTKVGRHKVLLLSIMSHTLSTTK